MAEINRENQIGAIVVESAIKVHRALGPGLLESVYEIALDYELVNCGLKTQRQVVIPVKYGNIEFKEGFKADLVIENRVILELKSVEAIKNVHKKQLLTYLRLSRCKIGYLLNFGDALMKDGISRIINV